MTDTRITTLTDAIMESYKASKLPERGEMAPIAAEFHDGWPGRLGGSGTRSGIKITDSPRRGTSPDFAFEATYVPGEKADGSVIVRPASWSYGLKSKEETARLSRIVLADMAALDRIDSELKEGGFKPTTTLLEDRGYFDGIRLDVPLGDALGIVDLFKMYMAARGERK